jgi:hypothetical protein
LWLDFYVLKELKTFDGIIGDDTLRELGGIVNRRTNTLEIERNIMITLHDKITEQVNNILTTGNEISQLIKKYKPLFGPLNE